MIVTQQRLHTNDLSGMLLEKNWPSLIIPAIATQNEQHVIADNEVYRRPAGELLQLYQAVQREMLDAANLELQ